MKKFLSALLVAGATTCTNAQFFSGNYGTAADEKLMSGHKVVNGANSGHFLMSHSSVVTADLHLVRTDAGGSATSGAPFFNNTYNFVNGSSQALANGQGKSLQYAGGGDFAVASGWNLPNSNNWGLYLCIVNLNGSINTTYGYVQTTTASPWVGIKVTGITESVLNPTDVYITGFMTPIGTSQPHVFALKVDISGNILWAHIYDLNPSVSYNFEQSYGIIESVYGSNDVMIVGEYKETPPSSATTTDAFLLRVDNTSGNPIGSVLTYGAGNSAGNDVFSCIRNSANTNITPSGDGYVMSGYTDFNGTMDYWFMAVDQTGTSITWSNTFDYSGNPGVHNDLCYDIIERYNTNQTPAQYEYFLTGTTNGPSNLQDIMVIKADQNGNGFAGGEFIYSGALADIGVQSDWEQSGSGAGLSIYGTQEVSANSYDSYMIKAYFNGITSCTSAQNNPNQNNGPGSLNWYTASTPYTFGTATVTGNLVSTGNESVPCFANTVGGGSNARQHREGGNTIATEAVDATKVLASVKNADAQSDMFAVYPNPGNGFMNVAVNSNSTKTIRVYDVLGKLVYETQNTEKQITTINLTGEPKGIYLVQVICDGVLSTQRVTIQ